MAEPLEGPCLGPDLGPWGGGPVSTQAELLEGLCLSPELGPAGPLEAQALLLAVCRRDSRSGRSPSLVEDPKDRGHGMTGAAWGYGGRNARIHTSDGRCVLRNPDA